MQASSGNVPIQPSGCVARQLLREGVRRTRISCKGEFFPVTLTLMSRAVSRPLSVQAVVRAMPYLRNAQPSERLARHVVMLHREPYDFGGTILHCRCDVTDVIPH